MENHCDLHDTKDSFHDSGDADSTSMSLSSTPAATPTSTTPAYSVRMRPRFRGGARNDSDGKNKKCMEKNAGAKRKRFCEMVKKEVRPKIQKKTNLKTGFHDVYTLEEKLVADTAVSNPFHVQVRTAIHKPSGDRRVVKVINKERVDMHKIHREISVMVGLRHENVVELYEAFQDDMNVYICMEYVKGGELFDQLVNSGRYSEKRAAKIIRGVIKGLRYLHTAGIAHCDIKPENIMFVTTIPDADWPKLANRISGMSQRVSAGQVGWLSAQCGTFAYRSPEQLDRKYSKSCDMWAVGVTMFMLLTGFGPFHSVSLRTTIKRIKEGFHPEIRSGYGNWFPKDLPISKAAMSLISQLLDRSEFRRLTPDEALRHPWLNEEIPTNQLLALRVVEQLQAAEAMSRFNRAICNALAQWIPKGEVYLLEKAFQKSDLNGDGLISVDEFRKVVQCFNDGHPSPLNEDQLLRVFERGDLNRDEHVDYRELILACVHRRLLNSEERLWRVFSELDLDNDNFLSVSELTRMLGDTRTEAVELVKKADKNQDGKISYEEFLTLWKGFS